MPINRKFWFLPTTGVLVAGWMSMLTFTATTAAPQDVEGMASIPFSATMFTTHVDETTRQQALALAELNAIDRYASGFSAAKYKLYQRAENDIKVHLLDYISQPVVIDEGIKKDKNTYYLVIRTTINTNRLDAQLSDPVEIPGAGTAPPRKISISFLFVARSTNSVRQFNDRVTNVQINSDDRSAKQSEGLSGGHAKFASSSSDTSVSTTGGSIVRQADQLTYAVSSPEDMNATMSQVFSDSGFEVYDYRDVSAQCGGVAPESIYKVFSTSDILSRELRKSTFDAAKRCTVNTFATGTLDIGLEDTDPITGQRRVYVSVRAQVNDVSGPLPRLLASVGPVQYSGLGPDQQVAMRNALTNAATEAAKEISNQLKSKGLN